MTQTLDNTLRQRTYDPSVPIHKRIRIEAKEGLWNLMTKIGSKPAKIGMNYSIAPLVCAGLGSYFSGDIQGAKVGAIVGGVIDVLPWIFKKYLFSRLKEVPDRVIGVCFDKGCLFKEGETKNALDKLEEIRKDLESQYSEVSAEEIFFRDYKHFFRKNARILMPGRYYKLPKTSVICADREEFEMNVSPQELEFFSGDNKIKLNVGIDFFYKKYPIPFAMHYKDKILRDSQGWEQVLESNLVNEIYSSIVEYFPKNSSEIFNSSILKSNEEVIRERIFKNHGVAVRLLAEKKNSCEITENVLNNSIEDSYLKQVEDTFDLINKISSNRKISPEHLEIFREIKPVREN